MGEKPINIGDLIDVNGTLGLVEGIGAHCTRICSGQNAHILMPNNTILENNIVNWVLSDLKIRTNVTVGVAYGFPVREVEHLLIQATVENPKVLRQPEPLSFFEELSDSTLIFEIYFWITTNRKIERRMINSAIRFLLDELFRKS